eukprot:Hpha_TRINITY_DN12397_c0_g3::TRINITY_DN12397_c0_g3_i1::g.155797::m.155797
MSKWHALGPASPPRGCHPGVGREQEDRFSSAERELAAVRQQMFPVILVTYGIDPRSEKAQLLARLLDLTTDYVNPAMPLQPRIAGSAALPPEAFSRRQHSRLIAPPPVPFRNVPDDILSYVLSFHAVPRLLMWRWHNVCRQWRRCLARPLLEYWDYLRLVSQNIGGHDYLGTASAVPRIYNVNVAVMRCPRCQREGLVEQSETGGTTWADCALCGTDGPFDYICDIHEAATYFPYFVRELAEGDTDMGDDPPYSPPPGITQAALRPPRPEWSGSYPKGLKGFDRVPGAPLKLSPG